MTALRPAIFLDRDGTLNVDRSYLTKPEQMQLLPGVGEALRHLQAAGFALVVVTNQSAVGRGMMTDADLQRVHDEMNRQLAAFGVVLDGIYSCTVAPTTNDRLAIEHPDRKPAPGMLLHAAADLHLELAKSFMIGDSFRDILAGQNAGCRGCVMVRTGEAIDESLFERVQLAAVKTKVPFVVVQDLAAAAQYILSQSGWKRWLVRGAKFVLAIVILFFVGWQFQRDLANLDRREIELRPGWLLASGGLYLVSLLPSAWFWRHLFGKFGYPMSVYAGVRAHLIGQLGKYVPGKAMAIAIRADLVHPAGVPYGVSIIASFYEVFTGMAAAAIVAAGIYAIEPPGDLNLGLHPLALGAVLIGLCGIPLLPAVFNFVIAKLTAKIQVIELYRLPPIRFGTLATGLLATAAGSCVQGLSVWAMLQAVVPNAPDLSVSSWAQCTAAIAFATVAGFAAFVIPAGFGVRESLMNMLLSPAGANPYIAIAVLLLRLVWIAAEALFAACTYWFKPQAPG